MKTELIKKFRKPVLIIAGIISAYALIGFVILPAIIKSKLPEIIETETGRKAILADVDFNPFSLELGLNRFSMQEKDLQTFVAFNRFFINVQVWESLINFALVLDEVSLSDPYVRLEMLPDEQYNFSDLLSEPTEEEEPESGDVFPLIINQINLVEGGVEIVESIHADPDVTLVEDLNFHLDHFSTLVGDGSKLGFKLVFDSGGALDWQGDFGMNPLFSTGELKIQGLKFDKIWKMWLQDRVQFKWVDGTQLIKFNYDFSYTNDTTSFKLTNGFLLTENLKFTTKENTEEIIDIPHFLIEDIALDLNAQTINIAKIESSQVGFDAKFNQAGELNFQTAFAVQEEQATENTEEAADEAIKDEATKPWEINVKEIALNESSFNFTDTRKSQAILINLAALDIGLKNYHILTGDSLQMTVNQGRLNLDDLVLKTNHESKLIHVPNFQINEIGFDLQERTLQIESVNSRDILINAWLEKNGEINYQNLFPPSPPAEKSADDNSNEEQQDEEIKPWQVNIHNIALNSSKINFSDKRNDQPVFFNIAALDIGINDYDVLAANLLQMTGNKGYVKLNGFELKTKQDPDLVRISSLQVNELGFNLQEKNLNIKSINSRDAIIKAWLAKNGEINYQSLFAPAKEAQAQPAPVANKNKTGERPWKLALEEFKIANYALEFTDKTPKKPVSLNLSELNFSIHHFKNKKGTKLPLSFSTNVNNKGKIKMTGESILEPFSADLQLSVNRVGINTFQPYINQSARLDIVGGTFNSQGKLAVSKPEQGDLKLTYLGGMNIKGLHTRDQILKQDFLKWQQLKFNGIDFNLLPTRLKIKSINLKKPYARVTIKKDKTTNIDDVIVVAEKPKKAKKLTKKLKKEPSPVYKISRIHITDGDSDFSDFSLILPFVVKLNDLSGTIGNISSNKKAKTSIDLKGKTFDLSPVNIQGSLDANLDDLDIAMHYSSLPLPFLSPYMVEFSGNKIEKGKLSLDLMYKVKDGHLTSTNNLLIDQLELGEKIENPDAVDLPLDLAIALLKDRNGKITINMPVEGSLDDPDFSLGPVVFDAFVNLITKVIASPFTAIGSFLGSDEDFSVVSFKPGSAEITAEQIVKLDGLASALTQKPELSLEVKGGAYTNQDWPAMKEQALTDELKQMRSEELKEEGKMKLPEYIELSEDDYRRLLADLFIQKFPELGKRSIFGTPKLIHSDMGEFDTVASNMLQGLIKPDSDKLLILSLTRARNIARYMVKKGGVEQARIFILDGKITPDAENNELNTNLSLKVQ